MTERMRSAVIGVIMNLCRTSRTPVAYLYNGVRLPALPEWDREAYPFAVITDGGTRPKLWLLSGATFGPNNDGTEWRVKCDSYLSYSQSRVSYTWAYVTKADTASDICEITDVVWANFDILNSDGSVYLAESVPIPVYE